MQDVVPFEYSRLEGKYSKITSLILAHAFEFNVKRPCEAGNSNYDEFLSQQLFR